MPMTFKSQYEKNRNGLVNDQSITQYNRNLFLEFFLWEEEKLKRLNGLPRLDESSYKTLCGYIGKLRNANRWFKNKAWNTLTEAEIKQVYNDLEDGKIKTRLGLPFKDKRSYYNKIFKAKPFQLAGLHDKVNSALEFFSNRSKREVRFISEEGFKSMVSFIHKPQHFALFWLAWDIGENIATLLELKIKHFKRQVNRETGEPEYLVHFPVGIIKRARQTRREPTIYPETVQYLDSLFKYGREVEYRDGRGCIRRRTKPYQDEDFVFTFKYRQALQIFDSVVRRAAVICEPNGEKPSWKDLRSGMACHLFGQSWHVEDINMRLGHSPQSRWLEAYINYLAVNRKRTIKSHFDSNLQDIKHDLEESKQREKLGSQRLDRMRGELADLKSELNEIRLGKGHLKLIMDLAAKQQKMSDKLSELSGTGFDMVLPGTNPLKRRESVEKDL